MKLKYILLSSGLLASSCVFAAANPVLSLSGINSPESVNLTLQIKNAQKIKNIKFTGLDNFQVLGREVNFNTSSSDESSNVFMSKFTLAPTKAESSAVYVTVNIDGKDYNSNQVLFNITPQQVDNFKRLQKERQLANQKQLQKMQDSINQQFKAQQQYFDNMNKLMQQQQEEMFKMQQQLFKNMESM